MARDPLRRSLSRQLDNIRKRYNRNADRYEKQAKTASPAMADALMTAARNERARAEKYRSKRGESLASLREKVATGLEDSEKHKATYTRQRNERRDILAAARLSGNAASKLYAATQSIWRGQDAKDRDSAIRDFFNSNAGKLTEEQRGRFEEAYGYELQLPLDMLDVQNLLEMNTGIDLDADNTQPRDEYGAFKRAGALVVARMMN